MNKEVEKGISTGSEGTQLPSPSNPFSVPKDYFEGLTSSILYRCELLDKPIASDELFSVPSGYFDLLPSVIESKIKHRDQRKPLILPFNRPTLRTAFAVAAILVFGLFIYRLSFPTLKVESSSAYAVTPEDIAESYMFEDLDESLISAATPVEFLQDNSTPDDFKTYLLENQIDLTTVDIEI